MSSNWVCIFVFINLILNCASITICPFFAGTELGEAKEKLQRADSSSSESEDEGVTKRKKIEAGDKPSEEVYNISPKSKCGAEYSK